jgi:poly(beta-D-mannuronate) lyase
MKTNALLCSVLILAPLSVATVGCSHQTVAPTPVAALPPAPLRSPWDATPVALTQKPYTCPASAPIAPDITITNFRHVSETMSPGTQAAAYAESSAALFDLARVVVNAADHYRQTGSAAAARCVATLLMQAATHHTMDGRIPTVQAWKDQNHALRAYAIAFLKVLPSGEVTAAQQDLISAWMSDIVHREARHYDADHCGPRSCARLGHSGLETAMAAAAIAIGDNDRSLFNWSLVQYDLAVDHIEPSGMLHYDLEHKYAVKFHIESAAALVQIAEFAELNGMDLYSYDNGRIHLLVTTVTRGLLDPSPFVAATGRDQSMPSKLETWQISWASVYDQRFPDPVIDQLLQQVNFKGSDMWGGEPWTLGIASSN